MTIYKYPFPIDQNLNRQTVVLRMPRGATVLRVAPQGGKVMLWALADQSPTAVYAEHRFLVYGTGGDVTPEHDSRTLGRHLGSLENGPCVWHVFAHRHGEDA